MTQIALLHKHYDQEHLETVKSEMVEMGAPTVRAIWSEMYGMWLAVEGCHRLRAAHALGITPVIVDISEEEKATIQVDEYDEEVDIFELTIELQDQASRTEILVF